MIDFGDGHVMLGYRYFFAASPLFPVGIVAVRGGANDWSAYVAGLPGYSDPLPAFYERVYREGCKLTEEQARGFFAIEGLRYRP